MQPLTQEVVGVAVRQTVQVAASKNLLDISIQTSEMTTLATSFHVTKWLGASPQY